MRGKKKKAYYVGCHDSVTSSYEQKEVCLMEIFTNGKRAKTRLSGKIVTYKPLVALTKCLN